LEADMPIKGAKYRVVTTKSGKKVRLAWSHGEVVEAKNIKTGATHTPAEFKEDKRKAKRRKRRERSESH
jgi:hypothetical protein